MAGRSAEGFLRMRVISLQRHLNFSIRSEASTFSFKPKSGTGHSFSSAVAFPVNLYLGLRLCYEKPYHPEWLFRLKSIAKYVYCGVCIVNWSYQLFLLKGETEELIYVSLIGLIVVDDIILLKWLFK